MKVGFAGLGKLGLPKALVYSSKGMSVQGVDVSSKRIEWIQANKSVSEPLVNQYWSEHGFPVGCDYRLLHDCDLVFVLAQTPSLPSGRFNLGFVEDAVTQINLVNPDCLVAVSSTVNIGDCLKLQRKHSRIAYNPSFIKQGSIIQDFLLPPYVLVGSDNPVDTKLLTDVWNQIHQQPIITVKVIEAEVIKLAQNVAFTLQMTLANAIGDVCEQFSVDSNVVLDRIYDVRRKYRSGLGYGGPCFPRDVKCFKETCHQVHADLGAVLAEAVDVINERVTVEKYVGKIRGFKPEHIGVVGLAFKSGVPYVYDSQAIKIIQELQLFDSYVFHVFDRLAMAEASHVLQDVNFCESVEEVLEAADVVFIGTKEYCYVTKLTGKPLCRSLASHCCCFNG